MSRIKLKKTQWVNATQYVSLSENFLKYVGIQLVQKRRIKDFCFPYMNKIPLVSEKRSLRHFIWKHDIRFKFLSRNIELPVYNLFDKIPFKEHFESNQ